MATPGGFWIRLAAWLVDGIVFFAAISLVALVLPGVSLEDFANEEFGGIDIIVIAGSALYDSLLI